MKDLKKNTTYLLALTLALGITLGTMLGYAIHPDVKPTPKTRETDPVSFEETVPETAEETEPTTTSTTEAPEPVTETTAEIIAETKAATEPAPASAPAETSEASLTTTHLGTFKLTAYCACSACCGQWADGITATGTTARAGRTIAVDPSVIPLGSLVYINGREYVAEDTGGGIKGNRIDIFFNSHTAALEFGIQYADVYISNF